MGLEGLSRWPGWLPLRLLKQVIKAPSFSCFDTPGHRRAVRRTSALRACHRPKLCWLCWNHVGTIFRSWGLLGAFGASCCVFCRSGLVFVDLGPLLGRFWKVSGGSGKGFGNPRASFFEFFLRVHASNAKQFVMCKNHSFS